MKKSSAQKVITNKKIQHFGFETSDKDEIDRRKLRAESENLELISLEKEHPIFGTFEVFSKEKNNRYIVEIRSLSGLENSCECLDFETNGLGTCKHIEKVRYYLEKNHGRLLEKAKEHGSSRIEIFLDRKGKPEIKVKYPIQPLEEAKFVSSYFSNSGTLLGNPLYAIPSLKQELSTLSLKMSNQIRIGRDVDNWLINLKKSAEHKKAKEEFLKDINDGKRTLNFLKYPLYPYQIDGMFHLAFNERSMLADDMGLGKTVQAIGACELLRQIRKIERVLIVSPASLKAEWEEQICKFTDLPIKIIYGSSSYRLKSYREKSFFYLTNYEQIRNDYTEINKILAPDIVILDEAQRIKNWQTQTAKAIKQLKSPYAFVLTGTPLENRIDEIYSIIQFLNPHIFGPLFKFNRDFYTLDEQGKPSGFKNITELHNRITPLMLRRKKDEVEDELPERTVNNYFVTMEKEQKERYDEYNDRVAKLLTITKKRPLTREELEKLQRLLACMRMLCDTTFILDKECRVSPKLVELEKILEERLSEETNKVIIFSEWERMLVLVEELAKKMGKPYALHTGSIPQKKRRDEIKKFKTDPNCSLFLSTDSGSVGLNLQEANVVINLDLPWNPAKLEQRIARSWRKHQTRSVSVINLVCEDSIEHRMLGMLSQKQMLSDAVLDGRGDIENIKMPSGRVAFMERMEALMGTKIDKPEVVAPHPDKTDREEIILDPYQCFCNSIISRLPERILLLEKVVRENNQDTILAVVDNQREEISPICNRLLSENFNRIDKNPPQIEVIDKSTYETLMRLSNLGLIKIETNAQEKLYVNSMFQDSITVPSRSRQKLREIQHKKATAMFLSANRKLKMSHLLFNGGFISESISPAQEAIESALKSVAYLTDGYDDNNKKEDKLHLSFIISEIIPKGFVSSDMLSLITELREIENPMKYSDNEKTTKLIKETERILEHMENKINEFAFV